MCASWPRRFLAEQIPLPLQLLAAPLAAAAADDLGMVGGSKEEGRRWRHYRKRALRQQR
jgi:hypothetical protein